MANRFCSSVVCGSLGLTTTVPSQAIPSNPVPTLSRTPSSTDVSTTSAKTPSMSRVSVSADRSLCDHNSTRPPVTTSTMRFTRAPQESSLLITQRVHRGETARLPRRVEGEDEPEGRSQEEGPGEALRMHEERHLQEGRDRRREGDSPDEADQAPEAGEHEGLGHEPLEDLAAGGADRHLDAALSRPVLEGGHLDVHVHDPAAEEGEDAREHEDQVVDLSLVLLPADAGADVVDAEVALLAVVASQHGLEAVAERLHDGEVADPEGHALHAVPAVPVHPPRDQHRGHEDDAVAPGEPVRVAVPPAEHLLLERAHYHHRDVADADGLADDLAGREERGPGLGPEQRDRASLGELLGGERPAALGAVPVERKVIAVDAAHLAILIGIGRANTSARDFLLGRPLHGPGVEQLRLLAVLAAETEVRRFERGRSAVLDRRRLLHHQPVHAPELRPALLGAAALAVPDREPAADRSPPAHPPHRLQARAAQGLPDLHPGLPEPLPEGAGRLPAPRPSGSAPPPP